jgi:hypothetical protein
MAGERVRELGLEEGRRAVRGRRARRRPVLLWRKLVRPGKRARIANVWCRWLAWTRGPPVRLRQRLVLPDACQKTPDLTPPGSHHPGLRSTGIPNSQRSVGLLLVPADAPAAPSKAEPHRLRPRANTTDGPIQLVERVTVNHHVRGSSPRRGAISRHRTRWRG